MNGQTKKTWCGGNWKLVATPIGFPQVESMCRTVPSCHEVAGGHAGDARSECVTEWRCIDSSSDYGCSGMDEQGDSPGVSKRASGIRIDHKDQAGGQAGLQSVRSHSVPSGLRSGKAGREAWMLSGDRLHGERNAACKSPLGRKPGEVEVCQKIKKGRPATEQSHRLSFRHGTKASSSRVKFRHFVPPRYKTPCFSPFYCSATGHLSRYAIYMGSFREGN